MTGHMTNASCISPRDDSIYMTPSSAPRNSIVFVSIWKTWPSASHGMIACTVSCSAARTGVKFVNNNATADIR